MKFVRHKEEWREDNEGKESLQINKPRRNPLMPMVYCFKVLGKLPLTMEPSGTLSFHLLSLSMAWALVITSVQLLFVFTVYKWRLTHAKYWNSFDEVLSSLTKMAALSGTFLGPLITWRDTPALIRAIQRWNDFQMIIQRPDRQRTMISVVLKYSYLGLVPILSSLYGFLNELLNEKHTIFHICRTVVFAVCRLNLFLFVYTWVIYCLMVKESADILRGNLIQSTTSQSDAQTFFKYRLLWIELQESTASYTDAIARTLHTFLGASFIILLLSVYGLLMFAFVDRNLDIVHTPESIVFTSFAIWITYSMGHLALKSIKDDALTAICSRCWSGLTDDSRIQLDLLLDAIETDKHSFEIKGAIVINRAEIIPLIYYIGTYLVVFMQLKTSTDHK